MSDHTRVLWRPIPKSTLLMLAPPIPGVNTKENLEIRFPSFILYFAKSARWVERKTAEIAKVARLSGGRFETMRS